MQSEAAAKVAHLSARVSEAKRARRDATEQERAAARDAVVAQGVAAMQQFVRGRDEAMLDADAPAAADAAAPASRFSAAASSSAAAASPAGADDDAGAPLLHQADQLEPEAIELIDAVGAVFLPGGGDHEDADSDAAVAAAAPPDRQPQPGSISPLGNDSYAVYVQGHGWCVPIHFLPESVLSPAPAPPPPPAAPAESDAATESAAADEPPCFDDRGRLLAPLVPSQRITMQRLPALLATAGRVIARALQLLVTAILALGDHVPWNDPAAFRTLSEQHAPGLFDAITTILTPLQPVRSSLQRAERLTPIVILDLLGRRSKRLTFMGRLRARLLRNAGTSELGMRGLHQVGEVPALSTVRADAAARKDQHPALLRQWLDTMRDRALALCWDDFHVVPTARAPVRPGATSRCVSFITFLLVALGGAGTRAVTSLASAAISLLPTPVVTIDTTTASVSARLRRLGAFVIGAPCGVLSFLHIRPQYVAAEQAELSKRGVFSTTVGRAASAVGAAILDYSHGALQRGRELADTFAAAILPGRFHSAADGFRALLQFFSAANSSLVTACLKYALFCPGDHWATLFATVSQQAAQRLLSSGTAAQRGFDVRSLRCISNLVPLLGSLHCSLGAMTHLYRRFAPLLQPLWRSVFGCREAPKRPRPERLHHLCIVLHAAYLQVRPHFLRALSSSTDLQDVFVLFFFEFHLPLALMMYDGDQVGLVGSACACECFLAPAHSGLRCTCISHLARFLTVVTPLPQTRDRIARARRRRLPRRAHAFSASVFLTWPATLRAWRVANGECAALAAAAPPCAIQSLARVHFPSRRPARRGDARSVPPRVGTSTS